MIKLQVDYYVKYKILDLERGLFILLIILLYIKVKDGRMEKRKIGRKERVKGG